MHKIWHDQNLTFLVFEPEISRHLFSILPQQTNSEKCNLIEHTNFDELVPHLFVLLKGCIYFLYIFIY